jgi:hypothetical protein
MSEVSLATTRASVSKHSPVRGSLRLNVAASSQYVTAGSDFSIFIVIQNPFDVPITIYNVLTHIPVELIDVNGMKILRAQRESQRQKNRGLWRRIYDMLIDRIELRKTCTGVAIAVGTDFSPEEKEFVKVEQSVKNLGDNSNMIGVQFSFPQNPSSEELDRIFRRLDNYKKGLIPVQLQPGDSVVKQFVLRTRDWLFFTPLTHTFQIQVNYSMDGVDHSDTISYPLNVRSTIGATTIGALVGGAIGTLLKSLTLPSTPEQSVVLKSLAISMLASIAVVVAFARKSNSQPIVSVEDFWGGVLVGFSVGFFGFERFYGLFPKQ